jgi:replicative DNA helicase
MNEATVANWHPASVEMEQSVLGSILNDNENLIKFGGIVKAEHFWEPLHRHLFEVMEGLINNGKPATVRSLKVLLSEDQIAEGVTTSQYLARLEQDALPFEVALNDAKTVRDLAARRAMMDIAQSVLQPKAKDVTKLAAAVIESFDQIVAEQASPSNQTCTMATTMARTIAAMAHAYQNEGRIIGMPTGLTKLDRKLLGFHRGDLIIMAGRPGMGKSALAICNARKMAEAGYRGIIFSQEMGDVALGQRMIADRMFDTGPANYFNFRSGRFTETVFHRAQQAADEMEALPLTIEPKSSQTVSQIAARARQAKRRNGLDFIVVDHLQITKPSKQYQNRVHQIGEITGGLKALAKDLDIAVILLSQLSRGVEAREDKRPMMSDLRDSGDIEQDADVILMLYREMYYLERREPPTGSSEHAVWQQSVLRATNKLEILIEKQRAGPTGTVEVFCNIGANAVRDLADDFGTAAPAQGELIDSM